jgi:hypothetical protein
VPMHFKCCLCSEGCHPAANKWRAITGVPIHFNCCSCSACCHPAANKWREEALQACQCTLTAVRVQHAATLQQTNDERAITGVPMHFNCCSCSARCHPAVNKWEEALQVC